MNHTVKNRKTHDNGAKLIFGDPVLCAQFLRVYTNIELLKDVQPEDIEDISLYRYGMDRLRNRTGTAPPGYYEN